VQAGTEPIGVIQIVLGRSPVGEDGNIPKYPAAYMKLDLGIVPGAQQSIEISNWFQDEVIAMINRAHPDAHIDAKVIGVFYHRKLFRGRYVYMVHAKNEVAQELVASTLKDYKIPMVPWVIYDAAKEMADMESGLKAFKETMATTAGAKLSSGDRRSLGRRYWNAHKDILKSIADEEFMTEHHLTDWAAASADQQELRQKEHTAAKVKCVQEQAALAKASQNVVDYVGNMEMPSWSDDTKESVEAYAIELWHQLGYHMQHWVKHPPSAVEHIRHEAPPPAKDPNAERLGCALSEEALIPEERTTNILEIDDTAGMAAEIDEISKKGRSRWRTPTGNSWARQQNRRRIEKISCGTRLKLKHTRSPSDRIT
jgi:hypothetical protein